MFIVVCCRLFTLNLQGWFADTGVIMRLERQKITLDDKRDVGTRKNVHSLRDIPYQTDEPFFLILIIYTLLILASNIANFFSLYELQCIVLLSYTSAIAMWVIRVCMSSWERELLCSHSPHWQLIASFGGHTYIAPFNWKPRNHWNSKIRSHYLRG